MAPKMSKEEGAYERLKADPAVGVADLESCFLKFFKKHPRDVGALVDMISNSGATWRTAPKVSFQLIAMSLVVISVFSCNKCL